MTNDPKKTALGWVPTTDPVWGRPQDGNPQPQNGYPQPGYPYGYQRPQQQGYAPQAHQHQQPQQQYAQAPQAPHGYGQTQAPSPQGYGQQAQLPAPPAPGHYGQQQQPYAHAQQPYAHAQQPYAQHQQPAGYPQQGYPQQPYSQHGYPQQPQQPYSQNAHSDHNQHAAAAMQSLRRRRAESSQRPISGANATTGVSQRVRFIRMTYLHLLGAILVFAGLLYLLMTHETLYAKVSLPFVKFALAKRWNWGIVLAAFMAISWVADYWASHARSRGMQYAGLGLYVIAEAVIFVPLLAIVAVKTAAIIAKGGGDPNILRDSAFVTLGIFTALTASVFLTKKDFSFLRSGLVMASGAALMLIILSLTFGFNLGLVFSVAMVFLAAGYILYQTSQVLAHYDPDSYVAASLALFSSVALMFWYVIRIVMRARQ